VPINEMLKFKLSAKIFCGFLLAMIPALAFSEEPSSFSPPIVEPGVVLLAHFAQGIQPDFLIGEGKTVVHQATLEPTGKWGKSLALRNDAYIAYPTQDLLQSDAGTIMFWVKPLWESNDQESHVFLSMGWNDGKQGYLALSDGWWEPDGADRLYFIFNNQSFLHTSATSPLIPGKWFHLAITWKSGEGGKIKIFLNGKLFAASAYDQVLNISPGSPLYFGTDQPSQHGAGRWSNALFDEMVIYERDLLYEEILERFTIQGGSQELGKQEPLDSLAQRGQFRGEYEARAIADEGVEWALTKSHIDRVLARVHEAGFNVYIPCVWHGAGTRFLSALAPPDEKLAGSMNENFDPLAYVIEQAHALGIEVHPWFTVVLRQRDFLNEYYDDGTPSMAFNIHNPAFRKFMTDLILDVVAKYDVDGVHLDYIRSMGICTSEVCQTHYTNSTGRNLSLDALAVDFSNDAWDSIAGWNGRAMTSMVSELSQQSRRLKPTILISGDGNPLDKRPRLQGRDLISWANQNLIDRIYYFNYDTTLEASQINSSLQQLTNPRRLAILLGNWERVDTNKVIPLVGDHLARLVYQTRINWPSHEIGVYLYNQLTNGQIQSLQSGPFSKKVPARKDIQAPSAPQAFKVR